MSEVSFESLATQDQLHDFAFDFENKQDIKNQFFSTFSQIFTSAYYEEEIHGIVWMDDLPIRMDKSGSPEFNPSEFGIVCSIMPILKKALRLFHQHQFKGSVDGLRIVRAELQHAINQDILCHLKTLQVDTRLEVHVNLSVGFEFEVTSHPKKRQIQSLLSSDSGLLQSINNLCILSQFLESARGVSDFRQLYKLAPQRAVDMFAGFLRELSRNQFEFKVFNDEVIWFFQEKFEEDEQD